MTRRLQSQLPRAALLAFIAAATFTPLIVEFPHPNRAMIPAVWLFLFEGGRGHALFVLLVVGMVIVFPIRFLLRKGDGERVIPDRVSNND